MAKLNYAFPKVKINTEMQGEKNETLFFKEYICGKSSLTSAPAAAAAASGCGPAASIPGTKSFSGAPCRGLLSLYPELSPVDLLPVIIRQIADGKEGVGGIILSAGWSCIGWLWVSTP